MKKTEKQWLDSGGYLPKFMRDFHDQKDIFKWIWRKASAAQKASGSTYLDGMNWCAAHVFVVDYFLWLMARHGYTLQPMQKKPWETANWDATIAEMKEDDAKAFQAMFADNIPTITVVDLVSHTGRVSPAQLEAWAVSKGWRRDPASQGAKWVHMFFDSDGERDFAGIPIHLDYRYWPDNMARSIDQFALVHGIQPSQVLREAAAIEVSEAP